MPPINAIGATAANGDKRLGKLAANPQKEPIKQQNGSGNVLPAGTSFASSRFGGGGKVDGARIIGEFCI